MRTITTTRSYRHWSKREEERLVKLREEERLKYRQIANKMDRTPLSVEKRYRKIRNRNNELVSI